MNYLLKFDKVAHIGNNVSHAKNRTKRAYRRNLHRGTVIIDGIKHKVLVPTKLLRKMRSEGLTTHFQSEAQTQKKSE